MYCFVFLAVKKSFTIVNPTPIAINYRMRLANFQIKYSPKYSLTKILNKLVAEVRGLSSGIHIISSNTKSTLIFRVVC